jgi:hypothetical protein
VSWVSRRRANKIEKRTGHVADDPWCIYWRGDFAGVDLNARCPLCPMPAGNETTEGTAQK